MNHCPIRWQALHNADSIALQSDLQEINYIALDNRLTSLSKQLIPQIDLSESTQMIRLVCIANNGIELLLLQLLCIRMGWLFCPLNPRFTENEIAQRLTILNSDYCWVSSDIHLNSPHHLVNTLNINFTEKNNIAELPLTLLAIDPTQACSIIFTSGSSGFPKAIVHHYKNHFFSALGSQALIPLTSNDHNLLSLPLFHVGGYATVIRTMIAGGCIHLTQSPLNTDLLQQRAITHLSLVSTQLIRLLTEPEFTKNSCKIKHILLGGSSFPSHLLNALAKRYFTYHLSYGCTEMGSQVATSVNNEQLTILPHRQVKIQNGQILLRGDTRCIGYFDNNKIVELEAEEWIEIGDTGTLKKSVLQISGRQDRQFISGGENIKPEEIERVCLQQKFVKQVFATPIKDAQYGHRVALFVAFYEDEKSDVEQQTEQLKHHLNLTLTRFKQPDIYLAWPTQSANNQALKIPKQVFQAILKQRDLI